MPYPRSPQQHSYARHLETFEPQAPEWQGLHAEMVVPLQPSPFTYRFEFPFSILMAAGSAKGGDEVVARDGLSEPVLRNLNVSLVPRNMGRRLVPPHPATRGGLSGRQRKRVADFIEAHLPEEVRLATLAAVVDLSPYHFARAFKQSFGAPPHRYHLARRIERAKAMLAESQISVTEIALALGFAETSSFSTAFRKTTGVAPRDYRRGLG